MDGDADLQRRDAQDQGSRNALCALPSYTSGIQKKWIPRREAGLENCKISKSTLILTTSPSSDLCSRIYIKVPWSTVQRALDHRIISVCGMFSLYPQSVVSSHVAWPNIPSRTFVLRSHSLLFLSIRSHVQNAFDPMHLRYLKS